MSLSLFADCNLNVRTAIAIAIAIALATGTQVWLTNLQHLREHQPTLLLQESREMTEQEENETVGMKGRRDVEAIECGNSQIQV